MLSAGEVRPLIETTLSDAELGGVISQVEAELVDLFGPAYEDSSTAVTVTMQGGSVSLMLPRRILSVESVTEYDSLLGSATGQSRTEGVDFYLWPNEGRLERIGAGGRWSVKVVVEYVPQDDRDKWRSVITDLVRLELDRTAMRSESVAGEYSYTAPESWEKERVKILRRIGFAEIY